jgi:hypothetical protein
MIILHLKLVDLSNLVTANRNMAYGEKTSVVSVQKREPRIEPIELEFELTRVLARVLSACANEKSLTDLQGSLRIEQSSLSRFVDFLSLNGFLERIRKDSFKQTEKGARLLSAFVIMYRAAANGSMKRTNQKSSRTHYAPCTSCARHIFYAETPPITMHVNGECQLCHTSSR